MFPVNSVTYLPGCSESRVPETPGDLERPGAGHKRLVQLAKQCMGIRYNSADPTPPAVVAQLFSDALGFAQALHCLPDFTELSQHRP